MQELMALDDPIIPIRVPVPNVRRMSSCAVMPKTGRQWDATVPIWWAMTTAMRWSHVCWPVNSGVVAHSHLQFRQQCICGIDQCNLVETQEWRVQWASAFGLTDNIPRLPTGALLVFSSSANFFVLEFY